MSYNERMATTMNYNESKETADTIRKQIGGSAAYMLGAHSFSFGFNTEMQAPYLAFRIKGSRKHNMVQVFHVRGTDTYTVRTMRATVLDVKHTGQVCDVYGDQLAAMIGSMVKLAVTL